ncbi:VanW family protein [Paenibacillus sp. MBLB4367]|uniref:VanW family protein n=1 Tax=Paenibacillus sp. MBLB4367 TaxID=3384767 RepID=UPI00390800F3
MKRLLIGGIVLGVLTAAGGTASLAVYATRQTVPSGVTVSGWQAEGLSLARFRTVLDDAVQLLARQQVRFSADPAGGPTASLTLEELGMRSNAADIAAELEAVRTGSLIQRAQMRRKLAGREWGLQITFDKDRLQQTIDKTWASLQKTEPVNWQRTVTPDDQVRIDPGKNAYRIDTEALLKQLNERFPPKQWSLGMLQAPIPLALPLAVVEPAITEKTLKAQGITRKIAEFSTAFPASGEGRIHNVSSAARTVHDMVLPPDGIFDYSKVIQETEKKFGFQEAPVILNGKLVPGVGGGICQVSSTLYNAVLLGGLQIVERRNHSLPVSYVTPGLDATYADGYINFKFRNNTGHHLLIRTSVENGKLTVKLFGQTPSDITYEVATKTIRELPAPNKYVQNPSLRKGKQVMLQQGKPGVIVETYRIKKQNGSVVSTDLVSRDAYSPQPALIAVNGDAASMPDDASPTPSVIEDGVRGPNFR